MLKARLGRRKETELRVIVKNVYDPTVYELVQLSIQGAHYARLCRQMSIQPT